MKGFPWFLTGVLVFFGGIMIYGGYTDYQASKTAVPKPRATLVAEYHGGSLYRYDDAEKRATCWVTSTYGWGDTSGAVSCVPWEKAP